MSSAGLGQRAVAAILDGLVFWVIAYVIALFTGSAAGAGFEISGAPFFLSVILWVVYYAWFEATGGATPGKRAVGLRVVRADGSAIGWPEALTRNVLRTVDGIVFYVLGAVLIATSERRQRLGDRVAGTVVVRTARAGERGGNP